MTNYLSLSRAARLAGVTRSEIQRRIRRGDIETFEGSVAVQDLLRIYPKVSLTDDEALERVELIRTHAVPRTEGLDAVLPSPEVLVSRLRSLSATLTERISALRAAEDLLEKVEQRLGALARSCDQDATRSELEAMLAWLGAQRRELAEHPAQSDEAKLLVKDTFLRIMAATVKLIPSGHEIFVEGTASILDAAVRAGLKLSYGCSSGNCGECKARVVSGEVQRIRDHDYVLSEREKQLGYILTCCNTAVTDVVLEAEEASNPSDLPRQEIRAAVRKLERISPNLISLGVQTPRTQTLRFMAGQRATLTLEDGSSSSLPIASCPCNGRNLWFFLRRDGTPFSDAVFGGLDPGHLIRIEGPEGELVLREDAQEPAVFIAVGDGIAPIKSLIEHAVSIDTIESCHLYWSTDYPEGHHQDKWCRALRDALDNFSFTPLVGSAAADLVTVVRADHPALGELRYYLAGPSEPVAAIGRELQRLGVREDRILMESTAF